MNLKRIVAILSSSASLSQARVYEKVQQDVPEAKEYTGLHERTLQGQNNDAGTPNGVLACYEGFDNLQDYLRPEVYAANYIDTDCTFFGEGYSGPNGWFPGFNLAFNTDIIPLGVIKSPPSHGVMVDVSLASGVLIWSLDSSPEFDIDLDLQAGVAAVSVSFVETCKQGSSWAPTNCAGGDVKHASPPFAIYDGKLKAKVNVEIGPILQFDLDLTASAHSFKFLAKDLEPNKRYVAAAKFWYFALAGSIDPALHGVGIWVGARTITSQIVHMTLDECNTGPEDYPGLEEALSSTIIDDALNDCSDEP